MTEVFDGTKEHVRAGIITKPSTVNQEMYQGAIRNRSGNFKFPVSKNFLATVPEQLVLAGMHAKPETAKNAVLNAAIMLAYPAISKKMNELRHGESKSRPSVRLEAIYAKIKTEFETCPKYKLEIEKQDSGSLRMYSIKLNTTSNSAYPENFQGVMDESKEAEKQKLNCTATKTYALCGLMLTELDIMNLDYMIDIQEDKSYDSSHIEKAMGHGSQH